MLVFALLICLCSAQTIFFPPVVNYINSPVTGTVVYGQQSVTIDGTLEYLVAGDTNKLLMDVTFEIGGNGVAAIQYFWITDDMMKIWSLNGTGPFATCFQTSVSNIPCSNWQQESSQYTTKCVVNSTTLEFEVTVDSENEVQEWVYTVSLGDGTSSTLTLTMTTPQTSPPDSDFDPPAICNKARKRYNKFAHGLFNFV